MEIDKEIELLKKDLVKSMRDDNIKQFVEGGKFVIKTLRGAMEVSESDFIYSKWLDTCDKELDIYLEKISEEKNNG